MVPIQCIDHLGFRIDTRTTTLSVPRSKVRDLRREAEKLLRSKATALHNLASFIEKAMAMTAAVFPARIMTRRLIQVQNQALANQWKWTAQVHITDPALEELEWWRT